MVRTLFFLLLFISSLLEAADSVVLMNADTGVVLFEKGARKKQYPASLTKIATAIYTLKLRENKLDKMLEAEHDAVASISDEAMKRSNYTLPAHWLVPGTSHMGIKRGEVLSLKDLLYGMMVTSAGDAANVIATYMGGSVPTFMSEVNQYLAEIGCLDTHFKNPHGLHHPDHQSTAYDMAVLTKEALKNRNFCEIVKTVRYTRPQTNKQNPTTLIQTNRLIKRGKHYYHKAIGVKTGYTSIAKNNLVAAAKDGDRTLIVVLMNCQDRDAMFLEAKKLFVEAFKEKKVRRKLLSAGPQKASLPLKGTTVKTYLKQDVTFDYYPAEAPKFKCVLQWDPVELPIEKDQRVGQLLIQDQTGKLLRQEELFALQDVTESRLFLKVLGSLLALILLTGLWFRR